VLVTGRATGVVVHTGPRSAIGRIVTLVATTPGGPTGPTRLQRRMATLSRVLGATAVAFRVRDCAATIDV
jgi:Ca2+-transporting ATPase